MIILIKLSKIEINKKYSIKIRTCIFVKNVEICITSNLKI